MSAQEIVDEAVRVAKSCGRAGAPQRRAIPCLLWSALGGGVTALVWLLTALV